MIKKLLILFFAVGVIILFPSCPSCDYDDIKTYYTCEGLELNHLDNTSQKPKIADLDSIYSPAYGIRITILDSLEIITIGDEIFIMSPKITKISIETVYDLNSEYPANSDITNLFVPRYSDDTDCNYSSFNKIIDNIDKSYTIPVILDIFLLPTTIINNECKFKIIFDFDDNSQIVNETTKVKLYCND